MISADEARKKSDLAVEKRVEKRLKKALRKITREYKQKNVERQLKKLLRKISWESKRGKKTLFLSYCIYKGTVDRLKSLGYYVETDRFLDCEWTKIYW